MLNYLKPISMIPARERVASAIRKAILSRELQEGEELTLESTAEMLGVSVTPVREAFQSLVREGLIKRRPNKGAIVQGINEKIVRDHYETRVLIESEIVRRVCRNNADLSAVIKIYNEMDNEIKNGIFDNNNSLDQMFHYKIWKVCGNERMRFFAAELWNTLSFEEIDKTNQHIIKSTKQHGEILEALIKRDEQRSSERMTEHIFSCMEYVLQLL